MLYSLVLPFLVGTFSVLQNAINKNISSRVSLPLSLLVNNAFVLLLSVLLFFAARAIPAESLPEIFRPKGSMADFSVRYLVPGLCGFLLITLAPWAIQRAGATRVFIGIVVAQIVMSMLWDFLVEAIPFTPTRLVGALLAVAGAILAAR